MKENVKYDKKSIKLVEGKTANFGELAKDCVAFANASGGCIDIGIEDNMELPDANQRISEGLSEKIVKRLNENTYHVAVNAEVLTAQNGGQYIKLHILLRVHLLPVQQKDSFLFEIMTQEDRWFQMTLTDYFLINHHIIGKPRFR